MLKKKRKFELEAKKEERNKNFLMEKKEEKFSRKIKVSIYDFPFFLYTFGTFSICLLHSS